MKRGSALLLILGILGISTGLAQNPPTAPAQNPPTAVAQNPPTAPAQNPPAALAQSPPTAATSPASPATTTSVSRTAKAANYRRAGATTKVDFRGTDLSKQASGEARVQSKGNRIEIDAKFARLDDPSIFGLEYLTYVLWAVSPQGREENLGELILKNGASRLKANTDMLTFGMVVTAEPYFAVTRPGNVVVLENVFGPEAKVENIDAKYDLLERGAYSSSNVRIDNAIFGKDPRTPPELFEARNAVRIARIALADKYAPSVLAKAEQQLKGAEEAYVRHSDTKTIESASREVVETAEEARVMAVKQKAEEDAQAQLAAEKKAAEEREAKARAEAEAQAKQRQEAEQERIQAEAAKAEAEKLKAEAEQARAAALEQQRAAQAEAEKARQQAEQAERLRQQAEAEKTELRQRLLSQLNLILQTRDTARGLIVNMSDVLFDFGSYTLRPAAREKLAKVAGIFLAYPGLTLQVEGHTDSVGSDEMNQRLSEMRAGAVRDYLVEQGVAAATITSRGFGKTRPVATNDTAEGRAQNRRVELVVSGEAIGGQTPSSKVAP
jgi:outer membrane protein OmpA-like peptidoglycan-associated protein